MSYLASLLRFSFLIQSLIFKLANYRAQQNQTSNFCYHWFTEFRQGKRGVGVGTEQCNIWILRTNSSLNAETCLVYADQWDKYYFAEIMQKKSRQLLSVHSVQKLLQQKRKSFQIPSTPTASHNRQTDHTLASKITYTLDEFVGKQSANTVKQLNTAKPGFLKTIKKVLLVVPKQKTLQKENSHSNLAKNEKSKFQRSEKQITGKHTQHIQSAQTSVDKRFHSCAEDNQQSQSSDSDFEKANTKTTEHAKRRESKHEEMFNQIKRSMWGEKEMSYSLKQKQNCFYASLKNKLKKQKNQTQHKQDIDRINFMIEGCNTHLHSKKTAEGYGGSKSTRRPQTAAIGLQIKCEGSISNCERVKTAKDVHYYSSYKSKASNQSKNQTYGLKDVPSTRSERQSSKQTFRVDAKEGAKVRRTADSDLKMKKSRRYKSQESLRMEQIIKDCEIQRDKRQAINDNMKIFQFYCKKMDERFERVTHKLEFVQNFQIQ